MSWFKRYLSRTKDLEEVYMPLYLKPASNLVGAPMGSMSHRDVEALHNNLANYKTGFIYDELKYQSRSHDVNALFNQCTHGIPNEVFFPECSNKDLMSYDCLVKTTNFILGFPFFTLREQGIRLMMKTGHLT